MFNEIIFLNPGDHASWHQIPHTQYKNTPLTNRAPARGLTQVKFSKRFYQHQVESVSTVHSIITKRDVTKLSGLN